MDLLKVHPYHTQISTFCSILIAKVLVPLALALLAQATYTPQQAFEMAFSPLPDQSKIGRELLQILPWKPEYRDLAWTAYKSSARHKDLKAEFEAKLIKTDDRQSPFLVRIVGTPKPGEPIPLVIAMHGGGGAPKDVNDQQWQGMFSGYYKDAPNRTYIYCALRAPNDEWNGFYDDSISQVVERLILAFSIFGQADPNRVVITGASHGGYGAFVICPKIPHRFAAGNASASAPTDGETKGQNLRNLYFTWFNGALDTAYGRADRVQGFAMRWAEWKSQYGGFAGGMTFLDGVGHSVPDRDKPAELLNQDRNLTPDRLIWVQTDERIKSHYYLVDPKPNSGRMIDLKLDGRSFVITNEDAENFVLYPPEEIALKEMFVNWGTKRPVKLEPKSHIFAESLLHYADPSLASPYRIDAINESN
jgi:hypothetical protein